MVSVHQMPSLNFSIHKNLFLGWRYVGDTSHQEENLVADFCLIIFNFVSQILEHINVDLST